MARRCLAVLPSVLTSAIAPLGLSLAGGAAFGRFGGGGRAAEKPPVQGCTLAPRSGALDVVPRCRERSTEVGLVVIRRFADDFDFCAVHGTPCCRWIGTVPGCVGLARAARSSYETGSSCRTDIGGGAIVGGGIGLNARADEGGRARLAGGATARHVPPNTSAPLARECTLLYSDGPS